MESRTLLSATGLDSLVAAPAGRTAPTVTNSTPSGYTPAQIRHAYGFDQITFNNGTVQGDGKGQTIAIVDAYNDPNIASDLAAFDKRFGVGAPPKFSVVNQSGGSRLPKTDSGWSLEISLDVEWAHAIAPNANILLVEASSSSFSNLLAAVDYAKKQAGVAVVSMSWGSGEFSGETAYDGHFSQPGVTFVASSGDRGAPPEWPAVSPNVLAIGGTSLTLNSDGTYGGETGWSGSGGGVSAYESKPVYQGAVTQSLTQRTNPDVAYDADPNTGFAVYDTVSYNGQTGWFEVGGTSAGAPQWSALIAIADQGRGAGNALTGNTQTLPALYNLSNSNFHDVMAGNNGYPAGLGYDLVTGRGSPVANSVVQTLLTVTSSGAVPAGTATSGTVTTAAVTRAASLPESFAAAQPTTGQAVPASFSGYTGAVGSAVPVAPTLTVGFAGASGQMSTRVVITTATAASLRAGSFAVLPTETMDPYLPSSLDKQTGTVLRDGTARPFGQEDVISSAAVMAFDEPTASGDALAQWGQTRDAIFMDESLIADLTGPSAYLRADAWQEIQASP